MYPWSITGVGNLGTLLLHVGSQSLNAMNVARLGTQVRSVEVDRKGRVSQVCRGGQKGEADSGL